MIGYHGWTVKMGFYVSVDPNLGGLFYQLKQASKWTNKQTHSFTHIKGERRLFPTHSCRCLPPHPHRSHTARVSLSFKCTLLRNTGLYLPSNTVSGIYYFQYFFLRTRLTDEGMKSRENKITGHFGQASKSPNRLSSREFCDLIVFHSVVCIRTSGALIKTQMAEPHPLGFSFCKSGGSCAEKVLLWQVPRWGWCFWYLGPYCESHCSTPWGKAWICF